MPTRRLSLMAVNEGTYFWTFPIFVQTSYTMKASFIHGGRRRGRGWGAITTPWDWRSWRAGLNKFFLLGTLSNKSFLTSPMNTLPAGLID